MKSLNLWKKIPLLAIAILAPLSCSDDFNVGGGDQPSNRSALIQEWQGPYGGVPQWDKVVPEEFSASFDIAIADAKKEIDAIANNPETPTFANTLVAMEKAGQTLSRLNSIFGVHTSNLNTGVIPKIEGEVNPKLAAYNDSTTQNAALFARIASVYKNAEPLAPSERRLVENTYKSFVRQGATLNAEQKTRLSAINQEISKQETQFSQNVLKDEEEPVTWVDSEAELKGLSASVIGGYKKAAKELGKPEKWAVRNTRSAMDPLLTYAENRPLREKVWKTFISRGDNGDKNDNNAVISKVHALRTERAKLLGYESHAHLTLENRMAKTPKGAMDLMMQVWPKAVDRVKEEVADMQKIATAEGQGVTIEGWDYRYYAEKVRKAKYDLDSNEVRQYLQLEKLVEAIHWMAGELFEFTFVRINDVPVFHPDVRVYKVLKAGNLVGLWYLDPYARDGKRSGAWMTDYRPQSNMDGKWITPIVSNNSNFVKTDDGKPVLVNWDDAVTLFHEFGHALHGLNSRVTYPSQAGTSVARDYVEFPAQLIEHWFPTKEVLTRFALHYETGAPMPEALLKKVDKAAKFNTGFETVEYLAAALVDMKLHLTATTGIDPKKFEADTLTELKMPKEIVMRHRLQHFLHLFNHGYEAGYYSYLWSDALTADAAEAFEESAGGYYDKKTAKSLIENIFSVGDTIDPALGFRTFRGRDVDTKALLRKRGFPVN